MLKQIGLKYNVEKTSDKKAYEILMLLKEYSKETGISFKHLVAKSVEKFLNEITKGVENERE